MCHVITSSSTIHPVTAKVYNKPLKNNVHMVLNTFDKTIPRTIHCLLNTYSYTNWNSELWKIKTLLTLYVFLGEHFLQGFALFF